MRKKSEFLRGIKDGLPICMGYLGVSFAFGIFAEFAAQIAFRLHQTGERNRMTMRRIAAGITG